MDSPGIALVTGAGGFLGQYVGRALVNAGWRVRAALRQSTPLSFPAESVVVGPIDGSTDWNAALSGAEAVVHLAARAHRPLAVQIQERELYMETNVNATRRLAQAAADANVRSFVFVSSVAVFGVTTDGRGPFSEEDRTAPESVYGETKLMAENLLGSIMAAASVTTTVVRPPLIYGHGAKGHFPILVRAVEKGIPLPLASVSNRRAFVAGENVADFILQRLEGPTKGGYQVFIIADDEQISTPEFIRRIARALNRPARLIPVPVPLLVRLLRYVGRAEMSGICRSLELDTSKARRHGWKPKLTMDEGLALAIRGAPPPLAKS